MKDWYKGQETKIFIDNGIEVQTVYGEFGNKMEPEIDVIAYVPKHEYSDAIVRVIEAAPELLEALEKIHEAMTELEGDNSLFVIETAWEVIQKARSE